jgi:hypothetical protein
MTDANAVAAYRRALARRGEPVIVRRIDGTAPNTAVFDAAVTAIVMDYIPRTPVADFRPEGAVTLGARNIIVLTDDLDRARFPLPVAKNDKVVVRGEELNIVSVDPSKRGIAGALDIVAMGV